MRLFAHSIGRARRLRLTLLALVALPALVAGCGTESSLSPSLNAAQIKGLDVTWEQRITALTAPQATASQESTKLYKACAAMDLTVPLLQVVKTTCPPTAVAVKLGALFEERCASPSRQCVRLLDRAKVANDNLLVGLKQLSDAIKPVTSDESCRAEFGLDPVREQAYQELSTAYDTMALGIERGDRDIFELGKRRVTDARSRISSKLTPVEQIERFRQSCGIEVE